MTQDSVRQRYLDELANQAAGRVTAELKDCAVYGTYSDATAAIRSLIQAEINAAIPGILRSAGVVVKDKP